MATMNNPTAHKKHNNNTLFRSTFKCDLKPIQNFIVTKVTKQEQVLRFLKIKMQSSIYGLLLIITNTTATPCSAGFTNNNYLNQINPKEWQRVKDTCQL